MPDPTPTSEPTGTPQPAAAVQTPAAGAPAPVAGAAAPAAPEQSAAELRAQWAADKARTDRQLREMKQVMRERDEQLKAASERAKLVDNPLDLILKSGKANEYTRELIKQLGASAEPELTEAQKVAKEVAALKAERDAEKQTAEQTAAQARAQAQTQAQHEAARATLADHAAKFPIAAGVATPEMVIKTLQEMHAANRRPTEEELVEELENKITAGLAKDLDMLLAIPAFRALVDTKLGTQRTSTADPQAIPGSSKKPPGIRTLNNKLSGTDADEVDWQSVPKHELRKRALQAIEKSRAG